MITLQQRQEYITEKLTKEFIPKIDACMELVKLAKTRTKKEYYQKKANKLISEAQRLTVMLAEITTALSTKE